MKKIRNIIYRYPVISSLFLILIVLWILETPFYYDSSNIVYQIIKEGVLALIVLAFIYFINGKGEIAFSNKGILFAFKKGWWALTVMLISGLFILILSISAHRALAGNPFVIVIEYLIYTLFIGLFEEGLIRGSFFNALLARNGNTFKGIMKAMIYSSILFGFIHVVPDILDSFPNINAYQAGQMLGKTVQSGMFGFLMAGIYLKNHNLWSVAIIHGLNDLLPMIPVNIFQIETYNSYVQSSPSSGLNNILPYVFMSILSIPFIVTAVKIAKTVSLPQPGMFRVSWFPTNVKK